MNFLLFAVFTDGVVDKKLRVQMWVATYLPLAVAFSLWATLFHHQVIEKEEKISLNVCEEELLAIDMCDNKKKTRMWANAQRDGRPAEHRWRPLFNAANFGWRPLPDAVQ